MTVSSPRPNTTHQEVAHPPRSGAAIRQTFLDFYAARGHKVLPSASLVPEDPTVLLTIAGMLPFKQAFLGLQPRPAARATSAQKCIRTNDIENVGRTARHHTYFEMLGNFSFGDYFKEQAILWAWELSTEGFGLQPEQLVVSVFHDDEASAAIWRDRVGVTPRRIVRLGEADNFWSAGPTGPCGPCSELYFDFHPERGDDTIDLEDDSRFIEFYNLVFMESNRNGDGVLTPLSHRNIDTGMGLERMAQILQQKPNNYETDLIYPLITAAASRAGLDYTKASDSQQTSLKVISDHARAVTQLVGDGVTASNLGRGYVLRRLIRRILRHGRRIGIHEAFLKPLAESAIALMEGAYPQLRQRQAAIVDELMQEEARFLHTLERGEKLLIDILATRPKTISGQQAFELYDTYGFPLELTAEIAGEQGLAVDEAGFEQAMAEQRQRAKTAATSLDVTSRDAAGSLAAELGTTVFTGYQQLVNEDVEVKALIVDGQAVSSARAGDQVQVGFACTCFYGESGGQVGDQGAFEVISGGEDTTTASDDELTRVQVRDVQKLNGFVLHIGEVEHGTLALGDHLRIQVDRHRRRCAQVHHTATHLLQAALKQVVGSSVTQAGSLVDVDRLRFDFHCDHALDGTALEEVESLVNRWILEAHPLTVSEMPVNEAMAQGAIAMFGEKYGEVVRVVNVPEVSMELCGGTHVDNTAEIGVFHLVAESGVAAGIRRIEAVAGPAVSPYLKLRDTVCRELGERFKAQTADILPRVNAVQQELKRSTKALADTKAELAVEKAKAFVQRSQDVGRFKVIREELSGIDSTQLQTVARNLCSTVGISSAVVLAGQEPSGKTSLVASFGADVVEHGLQAGPFVSGIATTYGGGGGGRPQHARAGGFKAEDLANVLQAAEEELRKTLQNRSEAKGSKRKDRGQVRRAAKGRAAK